MKKSCFWIFLLAAALIAGCGGPALRDGSSGFSLGRISDFSRQPLFRPIFERALADELMRYPSGPYTLDVKIERAEISSTSFDLDNSPTQSSLKVEISCALLKGGEAVGGDIRLGETSRFSPGAASGLNLSEKQRAMEDLSARLARRLLLKAISVTESLAGAR